MHSKQALFPFGHAPCREGASECQTEFSRLSSLQFILLPAPLVPPSLTSPSAEYSISPAKTMKTLQAMHNPRTTP